MRLGALKSPDREPTKARFNSSLVRLGAVLRLSYICAIVRFNSSLVRLGVVIDDTEEFSFAEFQFQLGAIGRACVCLMRVPASHVSIPAWCDWETGGTSYD